MSDTFSTPSAKPVQPHERVDFVDILRGFAIFGILVINIIGFSGQPEGLQSIADPIDRFVRLFSEFFFRAKFYTLFSFLFGWGMAVILRRAEARGTAFARLYRRRLLILLVIGILHGTLLWAGDILTTYALFGFLLLWFRKRSDKTILITSLTLLLFAAALTLPWGFVNGFRNFYEELTAVLRTTTNNEALYGTGTYTEIIRLRTQIFISTSSWFLFYFGNVFAMFLWGLYVGRRRFFEKTAHYSRQLWQIFGVSLLVAMSANGLFAATSHWGANNGWPVWIPADYYGFVRAGARSIGAPAMMLVYVTGIILLQRWKRWRQQLAPMANVGRMALTNYIFQSIVGGFIFYNYGLGLYGEVGPSFSFLLVILIYLWQIQLSGWWLERYQYGPLEWVWRSLTYGRRQPMRRGISYDDLPTYSRRDFLPQSRMARWLTAVWTFLLVWTVALGFRAGQTGQSDESVFSTIAGEAAPTPKPTAVFQPTPTATPIVTPVVQPVEYNPGPIAAAGDMRALADAFDPAQAMVHIDKLAGPEFGGRLAGSSGGYKAAAYIADAFARYGLQPAGENGTFFQSLPLHPLQLAETPQLIVETAAGREIKRFSFNQDFSLVAFGFLGSGIAEGDVMWANNCQRPDFDTLNVVGQIVLCRQMGNVLQAGRNAVEHGAVGLLLLPSDDGRPADFAFPYSRTWLPDELGIPTFRVDTVVAEALMQDSDKNASDLTIHFTPFPLNTRVRMSAEMTGDAACAVQPCMGRNVLGVLPGRNPDYTDEIVILGGHYDHMGHSPDGTIWAGANDNASGIATLLEIARVWYEQGFVPQRTVLFAAWDGEELGLLGSSHYVEFPHYPLDKTVGAVQLDMVGAGEETLYIDGSGGLEADLQAIAAGYGITNTLSNTGRSDHTPFLQADVPSNLLIWFGGGDSVPSYHRPIDMPSVIEPEKLAGAGRVAGSMALALAEVQPQIEQLLAQRAAAIENENEAAFLDTAVTGRRALESAWFTDVQSLNPLTFTLTSANVKLLAQGAVADVNLTMILPIDDGGGNRAETLSLTTRFLPGETGWQWAGAELDVAAGGHFMAALPPNVDVEAAVVADTASQIYTAVTQKLGLSEGRGTIWLYPDSEALRGDTAVSLPARTSQHITAGSVRLLYSPGITASQTLTNSMAQLALANAGVNEADAPWLWQGVPLALAAESNLAAAHMAHLPVLVEALAQDEMPLNEAAAYAVVDYLQRQIGWQGIGELAEAVGRSGWDAALRKTVNLDSDSFARAWQNDWQNRLATVDAGVTAVLMARTQAVQNGNQTAFLNTVDGRVPHLQAEQAEWFAALTAEDSSVVMAGQPIVLYPDGRVLANITLTGLAAGPQGARVLFTPNGNGWRWAGALFAELGDEKVMVLYPVGQQALAQQIQEEIRRQAPRIAADLDGEMIWPMTIKLYTSQGIFQTAVSPALGRTGWVTGWAGTDESVRLRVAPEMERADWQPALLAALTRQELARQGVTAEWLLKGVSLFEVERLLGSVPSQMAEGNLMNLIRAVNRGGLPSLAEMPSDVELGVDDGRLVNAGALDAVRYVTYKFGQEGLVALARAQAAGIDLETAVFEVLGQSLADFEAAWTASLAVAHVSFDWLDIVNQFEVERALVDIAYITQPDFSGRQAGSPGAASVAKYIADQFDAAGLRPMGDVISSTQTVAAYAQTFPVQYAALQATPRLDFVDESGQISEPFVYREDFVTVLDQVVAVGDARGELVLVSDSDYAGMDLTGKIVLRLPTQSWTEEAMRAAAHGAEGLILVSSLDRDKAYLAKPALPITFTQTFSMPVLALTQPGYRHFLEMVGQTQAGMTTAPASLPLGVQAAITVWLSEPEAALSANVLGLWPGADPVLGDEVIILGAHYDYVGDDPDLLVCGSQPVMHLDQFDEADCQRIPGLDYSGANDNASGVAVILEILRLWQETGYQPRRSVLFAAWGAQEPGQVGSNYYVAHPAAPLTQTVGILQLDAVGGGGGYYLSGQGVWEMEGKFLFGLMAAETLVDGRLKTTTSAGISDQRPFREAGVPGLLVSWTDASEANWPDTIADEVEPFRLGVTGRMVALTMMSVAR